MFNVEFTEQIVIISSTCKYNSSKRMLASLEIHHGVMEMFGSGV